MKSPKIVFVLGSLFLGCILFLLVVEDGTSISRGFWQRERASNHSSTAATKKQRTTFPMYRQNSKLSGRVKSIGGKFKKAWSFQGKSAFHAACALSENSVFCVDGKGTLYCLSRQDGKKSWQLELGARVAGEPLLLGEKGKEHLYLATTKGRYLSVESVSGKILWQKKIDDKISAGMSFYLAHGETFLLLSCHDGYLYSLAAETGETQWKADAGEPVNATPALVDETIIFGCCDGKLRFVSTEGKEIRKVELGSYLPSSPAIEGVVVYTATHGGKVVALKAIDGQKVWTFTDKRAEDFLAPPAISKDYVVVADQRGNLFVIEKKKGSLVRMLTLSGDVSSEPVVDHEKVVIADKDGFVHCFALSTGKELWKLSLGSSVIAPLTLCDEELYVGDKDGFLTQYLGDSSE